MEWYIVVRDTNNRREYLCYTESYGYCWLVSGGTVEAFMVESDAHEKARVFGGKVITLKEDTE